MNTEKEEKYEIRSTKSETNSNDQNAKLKRQKTGDKKIKKLAAKRPESTKKN